jgi:hypothetical protein
MVKVTQAVKSKSVKDEINQGKKPFIRLAMGIVMGDGEEDEDEDGKVNQHVIMMKL